MPLLEARDLSKRFGGLMLGLIDSVVATALGAEPAFLLSFVFIILLLLFRPAGLFGHAP